MAISLKVLAPNKNVYQGEAEEVILPSTTGQLGVCLLYTSDAADE